MFSYGHMSRFLTPVTLTLKNELDLRMVKTYQERSS